MHDTQISETYPALNNMSKMSKFEVTARFVWSVLEKKTAAMGQEEQEKYKQ